VQQLSQQDAGFLYSETPRVPMHICSLHVYDPSTAPKGQVTFDAILGQVSHRLPLARVLRRKLVRVPFDFDYPYWVEDRNFDLEFHIRNIALPAPGDWRQLWVQAARLHSYPLDLSRPPWELYVIEGLDNAGDFPEGSFGIFIKVHHSAIDGVSGIELMNALHDLSPDGRAPTLDTWRGEDDPAPWETLARAGQKIAFAPARFLQLLTTTMPAMRSAPLAEPERTSPPRLPTTPLNRQATTNRVGDAFRFDLELAKRIRSAVPGATVNDVVLTVVGGGLRAYLDSKGELPTTPLHAGVPISLRTDDEKGQGGNRISLMIVSLGTDQAGALDRLKAVRESTSQSKEANAGVGARALAEASELFPGALLGLAVRALPQLGADAVTSVMGNVCVTNVPGSQVPLYLCGARMDSYYGLGPVYDYAGPIHLVVSYLGKIHLAVTSCHEHIPDIQFYVQCLQKSLAELDKATRTKKPRARTSRSSSARSKPKPADRARQRSRK
jgi:diacylglycerol O-acyltransferase